MSFWQMYLSALGGTASLLVLLGFFGRSIVGFWLSKDLESHKAKLKAETDIELARLESKLAQSATQRQIVFSKLHEKRAELVSDLYALFSSTLLHMRNAQLQRLGVDVEKPEPIELAYSTFSNAYEAFEKNKIWFSPDTADIVDQALVQVANSLTTPDLGPGDSIGKETADRLNTALRALESEFRALIDDLQSEVGKS